MQAAKHIGPYDYLDGERLVEGETVRIVFPDGHEIIGQIKIHEAMTEEVVFGGLYHGSKLLYSNWYAYVNNEKEDMEPEERYLFLTINIDDIVMERVR